MKNLYDLSAYHFDLPPELIAQAPCEQRDQSRLLIVDRIKQTFQEIQFSDLHDFLSADDRLILNDTKVIPARLLGQKLSGGNVEILLSKQMSEDTWEVLAKPAKKLPEGSLVIFGEHLKGRVMASKENGIKWMQFLFEDNFLEKLALYGQLPLPTYIRQGKQSAEDIQRYQTRFAANPGAVAAPTAGLHFSDQLLDRLAAKNVRTSKVTLHVGLGTFRPVQTDDIRQHPMHEEYYSVSQETADQLNHAPKDSLQICVGTTACRVMESITTNEGVVVSGNGYTNIFIYPGYRFKFVKGLLTNFHWPCSTLLMLVCAFGGYELMMEAYQKAIKDRFRFYSYGDAMLIL